MIHAWRQWLPTILLALAGVVMLVDFVNPRRIAETGLLQEIPELAVPQPWGGYAWRTRSRAAADLWRQSPAAAEATMQAAAVRYPLDAGQWLTLAEMRSVQSKSDDVAILLERALAAEPYRRDALWSAAQIALQTNDPTLAESHLRRWLVQYPADTERALFIGRRWISEPGALLDRMLPDGREFLVQAMQVARRQGDSDLARAVWQRLEPAPSLDEPAFLNYIELLLDTEQFSDAIALWAEQDDAYSPGGVPNGSFRREIGEPLGLNWRIAAPAGVRIERDLDEFSSAPASLAIQFNGKENTRLGAPWVRVPVDAGQWYRLHGSWKADGLTTRALPYVLLTFDGQRGSERVELPGPAFDWRAIQFDLQVPPEARILRIMVRRDPTDAFDRNIDGTLWLDDLALEPIPDPEPVQMLGPLSGSGIRD